jgi:hypothetical protein
MARQKVIIPEVIEPDEKLPRDLVALRKAFPAPDGASASTRLSASSPDSVMPPARSSPHGS